ncbi:acyltransferase [Alkalihalobacillus macyae]|uniref:acyltransferase family protein n=1 Tax=Guptibacillus hwajinpoensis TaxID=208199 RepID=UPI00273BB73C|nr:acyltransferase [Alkalihalobacillus macyae]MDP4552611.1 acyltransferase [Alkalihalobacillus macyae]
MGKNNNKLSLVQISRAIAIFFVLIGHANGLFYNMFDYDWFNISQWNRTGGVDFFFVVSGFMIYYLYFKNRGNQLKAKDFLIKRLIRIFPLYWLMLFATIALLYLFPGAHSENTLTLAVFLQNLLLFTTNPLLDVTWSLSYILFFYLVFTSYLLRPKIMKYVIIIWLSSILLTQLISDSNSFLLSVNHIEIYLGCLAAYLVTNIKVRFERTLLLVGLNGFLFLWLNNIYFFLEFNLLFLYSVFSMMIILGITAMDLQKKRKIPKHLSLLGDASYSVYICHGPIIQFFLLLLSKFRFYEKTGHFIYMSIIICLTTLTCIGIYLLVERPMTKFLRKYIVKRSASLHLGQSPEVEKIS